MYSSATVSGVAGTAFQYSKTAQPKDRLEPAIALTNQVKSALILLYFLNITFYVLAALIVPICLSRRFHLGVWNLLTIPLVVGIPLTSLTSFSGPYFFLENSLFNPYFQYALLVNNVYVTLQAVTLIFLVNFLQSNMALRLRLQRFASAGVSVKPERMRRAGWVFLLLYLLSFLLLTQSYGLIHWIISPRTGYQLYRTGEGQWYAFCLSFLSVSLFLTTVYAKSNQRIVFLAPLYLFFVYLLGSKANITSFALYLVIILAIRQYRYLSVISLIVGVGGAAFIISTFVSSFGSFTLENVSQYSDYYVNAAMYYKSYLNGNLPLYHGDIFLSSFWSLVPRGFYPDKPYVYGILKVVDVFYPGEAALTNTPAFATVGNFADFGWPQVIFSAILDLSNLLLAFLYATILPRLSLIHTENQKNHSFTFSTCLLLVIAPSFLVFFSFPFNIILFLAIIGMINLANRVRFIGSDYKEEPALSPR